MRLSLACVVAVISACAIEQPAPDDVVTGLPPGAESTKADGEALDFEASHCEIFVDRVITSRTSQGALGLRLYVKTLNDRLDDQIASIGYYGWLSTEDGGTCGDTGVCQLADRWHWYEALPFANIGLARADYWTLDFPLGHELKSPLKYEGAFFVRTLSGKTLWVNPQTGGNWNFFLDRALAYNVEALLGGASDTRDIDPENALVAADSFPYLNPDLCR